MRARGGVGPSCASAVNHASDWNWPPRVGVLVVTLFVAWDIVIQRKAAPATADTVDVGRRDQADRVTQLAEFARPAMCPGAGLHRQSARRLGSEELGFGTTPKGAAWDGDFLASLASA
jgi:hypothetical protein